MLSCEQKCIWKITWISVQVLQNSWNLKCVYFDRKVISICYLVVIFLASLVAQRIKHLPAMLETQVRSLGWEDPLEKEMATHSSTLAWKMDGGAWRATVHGVAKSRPRLSDCFAYSCIISRLLFLFRLLYNIEQSSLCYLSNRSLLVIHFIYSSLYISIPNSLTIRLLPFPPVARSLFSESVNLFLT